MPWGQGRAGWGTFDIPTFGVLDTEVISNVQLSLLEDGGAESIVDTFNRPDENPLDPTKWTKDPTNTYGTLQIVGKKCIASTTNPNGSSAVYTATPLPPNQFVEFQIAALKNDIHVSAQVMLRAVPTTLTCYALVIGSNFGGPTTVNIVVNVFLNSSGPIATPIKLSGQTVNIGDVFRFQVIESVLSVFQNGLLIATTVDTSIKSGNTGIFLFPNGNINDVAVTNFKAGASVGWDSGIWTQQQALASLNNRQRRFLGETGTTVMVTYQAGSTGTPRMPVPENTVDIRRVAWANEADPTAYVELPRADVWELDHGRSNWPNATDVSPTVYMEDHLPSLTIELNPAPTDSGEVELTMISDGIALTGLGVPLSIPDDFSPYLAWGLRADLLAAEGEGNDPDRASHCSQRYDEGIELARIMVSGGV